MELPSALSNIPPKRLALIVGGGIGAGLLWRKLQNRKQASSPVQTGADGQPLDLSQFALAQNSAGNLGAGGGFSVPTTNDATRDTGTGAFPLPIATGTWVDPITGIQYYITSDGTLLGPVNVTPTQAGTPTPTTTPDTTPAPSPVPTPAPTPAPVSFHLPAWLTGAKFVRGSEGAAVYSVTPEGLEWIPTSDAFYAMGGIFGPNPGGTGGNSNVLVVPSASLKGIPRIGATPDPQYDPSL